MSEQSNVAREKALALLPKFSAFLSVIGSGFITYDILCNHFNVSPVWWRKKKRDELTSTDGFSRRTSSMASARGRSSRRFAQRKTLKNSAYYRLMLSMSCSDFFVSFAWFCTTWPIPKDENSLDNPSETVYGNIGNTQTCTAQAFFIQLGIITPFYNALLACYYYLTIRREWKEEDFKCRIEYAGHFVSISFGLGTSIAGLVMDLFNNSRVWCWIAPYPSGCGDSSGQTPCVRGINSKVLRWVFYYGPLWVMIFLVALFMSLVYMYVRSLDNKMDQYTRAYRTNAARGSNDSGSGELGGGDRRRSLMARTFSTMNTETLNEQRRQRRNERSKAVANQGLFYAGTFALVWVFGTIVRAMQLAGRTPPWIILFWFAVFTPSQGFFNFLVYIRPRLIKFLEKRKKKREGRRNSKTGSSFNSDILHVSGISAASSSNEVTGENQNRDASTRSDLDLSEPFTKPKSEPHSNERCAKVRFAPSRRNLVQVDKKEYEEPEYPAKVRFITDDKNFRKSEKKDDAEQVSSEGGIATVGVTFGKNENVGSPEVDISDTFDERTAESEETIDPDLLSSSVNDDEVEKEEILTAKEDGEEVLELHNATIDLATGEVRTRTAVRRVSPP